MIHTPSFVHLLSFIFSSLEELRHLCAASDHQLLLVLRSSGQEGLRRARHCLDEEVVDRIGRFSRCPLARQRLPLLVFYIQPSSTR